VQTFGTTLLQYMLIILGKNQVLCHSITPTTTFLRQFCLDVCNNEFFFSANFYCMVARKKPSVNWTKVSFGRKNAKVVLLKQ
jgi:hypothetical protein